LRKTVELAIGAALLSHVLLALLWLGWAVSWLVVPLTLAVLFRLLTRAARFRVAIADAVFLPYILLYLVFALAPPTAPDAIGYHLGLASEWLRSGSLARSAVGYYDVIPHGLETLFMAAAAIGGLSAASLVHFAFLLATLPLIAGVATRARLLTDGPLPCSILPPRSRYGRHVRLCRCRARLLCTRHVLAAARK
jgi:hypothetical protein